MHPLSLTLSRAAGEGTDGARMNQSKKTNPASPSPALRERVRERERSSPVLHRKSTVRARTLRRDQTKAELVFWSRIKAKQFHGLKFKRQFPIGKYIVDFICLEKKIIVEIDGGQHCESLKDEERTRYLNNMGYEVIRFWNNDILSNIEGVLLSLSLTLSRAAGEGIEGA
jgi:very-short-patch-repair endonuclease